jgi:hypothetical protein
MPTQSQVNQADINKDTSITANELFKIYRTPTETIDNESTLAIQETDILDGFEKIGIPVTNGMYKEKEANTRLTYDTRRTIPEAKGKIFTINSETSQSEGYDPDADEQYIAVDAIEFTTDPALISYEKITRQEEMSKVHMIDRNLYSEFISKTEDEHLGTQIQHLEYQLLKSLKKGYTMEKMTKNRTSPFATNWETTTNNKFTGSFINIKPVLNAETFLDIKINLRRSKKIRRSTNKMMAVYCIFEHFYALMKSYLTMPEVVNHYMIAGLSQNTIETIKSGRGDMVDGNLENKMRIMAELWRTEFAIGNEVLIKMVPDYFASELWNNTTNKFDMAFVMPEAYTTIDMLTPKPILGQLWSQNAERVHRPMPKVGHFVQEKINAITQNKFIDGLKFYSTAKFSIVPSSEFDKAGFIAMDNSMIGNQTAINALKASYDTAYTNLTAKFGI